MFGLDAWIIWLIIGVIFIISEIFTVGFVMMPLGLAALASSFIAYLFPKAASALNWEHS
jgi:membrane protein implicated in regulation of membrane protease activity